MASEMLRVEGRDFKKSRRTLVHGPEPRSSWKVCWFGGMRGFLDGLHCCNLIQLGAGCMLVMKDKALARYESLT